MKAEYIGSLTEGVRVDSAFALRSKELRSTRAHEAYLSMELADRTGRVSAVLFRPDRAAEAIPSGTVIRVRGTVTSYRGVLRISVESMTPAAEYTLSDMMPSSSRDRSELIGELRDLVRSVEEPALARVLRAVFGDREFFKGFVESPAAQAYHHAYVGGLLEHTVAVATACSGLASLYPDVDRDLLVTGALMHDIGKVDELSLGASIEYTDEGRLLGHVVLGERRLRTAVEAMRARVPDQIMTKLSHIMISHHGELEWGSPKRPCTLEALVLHHADNMDAKTAGFIEAAQAASRVEEPWTDAMNLFQRPLYAPRAVEDDRHGLPPDGVVPLRKGA